jgi:uncharacterized membrane protein (DUF4010 family)
LGETRFELPKCITFSALVVLVTYNPISTGIPTYYFILSIFFLGGLPVKGTLTDGKTTGNVGSSFLVLKLPFSSMIVNPH